MNTRIGIIIAILSVILSAQTVRAQQPAPPTPIRPAQPVAPLPNIPNIPSVDPLGDVMFPPDLIMRHARELGLTNEQKMFMRGEIQKATTRFNELQWQLQEAMEVLHQTMESDSVSEQQALIQLDKVLDVEREIKRLHIGMGIRLKNQLAPAQQEKLHAIAMASRPAEQRP